MRFSHKDKKDIRVSRQSTYAFDYPSKLDQAPEDQGAFVLLNESSDVLYVGYASSNYFEQALTALIGTTATDKVVAFRWFVTECENSAKSLAQDWIVKYKPHNQNIL
jgi:excinuclease UvrABC nuclease subunit